MKEYNVILKKDVDYDGFWEDMETETDGLLYIPNRRIEFTNERPELQTIGQTIEV